jgi:hypothetical protein
MCKEKAMIDIKKELHLKVMYQERAAYVVRIKDRLKENEIIQLI